MDHGKFGPPIGSSSSSDDRFGYFGGAPGPALPAATNPFGGSAAPSGNAVAGAPTNPFDGSYAVEPAYGLMPSYAPPPTSAPTRRRIPKVVAVLAVLVVLGGGFYGWNLYQRMRPLDMPLQFAGQQVNTSPAVQSITDSILSTMHAKNPGLKMDARIYGTGTTAVVLLAARAGEDVSSDLVSNDMLPPTQVGDATCAMERTGTTSICLRTSSNLTVAVLTFTGGTTTTGALVDQAWGLF
jgi:hypothetical protein